MVNRSRRPFPSIGPATLIARRPPLRLTADAADGAAAGVPTEVEVRQTAGQTHD